MIDWTKERTDKNYCGYCIGSPPSANCNGDCFKDTAENYKERREEHTKRMANYHKAKLMDYHFDQGDWNSMHDCLANATYDEKTEEGKSFSQRELEILFFELPEEMQFQAFMWGMSDTPWRDNLFTWYQENKM